MSKAIMQSPAAPLRVVRSYARREDADHARTHLAEHGIEAQVDEQRHTDKESGLLLFRGTRLLVARDKAHAATRLLLRMPPTEAPDMHERATKVSPLVHPGKRVVRRLPRPTQSSAFFVIVLAIVCGGFATIYGFWKMFSPRKPVRLAVSDLPSYTVEEDVNYDGKIDRYLDYTPDHRLVKMAEDRDFDGNMDLINYWKEDLLLYRDRDIDANGIMDERTVFGPDEAPLYVDLRPNGKGLIKERRIYRTDRTVKKILLEKDGDTNFDILIECDEAGKPGPEKELAPDSPDQEVPKWEPGPEDEFDPGPSRIGVQGG